LKERLYRLNFGWEVIVLALLIIIALSGTQRITTSPNKSFVTQIPNFLQPPTREEIRKTETLDLSQPENRKEVAFILFRELAQKNPELATELGRIPEFADNQLSQKDLKGLKNFVKGYLKYKSAPGDENIKRMITSVGKKEYRKFCTPIQMMFWIAEKEEITEKNNPFELNLNNLLNQAWGYSRFPVRKVEYKGKKWDEFSEVVDRLNSSYLISKYLVNNFEFVYHSGTTPYSPRYFFKIKKGDCKDFAKFAVYCLRRAGYDAKYTRISFSSRRGHVFVTYIEDGKFFAIDNGKLIGPFDSYPSLIKKIRLLHR